MGQRAAAFLFVTHAYQMIFNVDTALKRLLRPRPGRPPAVVTKAPRDPLRSLRPRMRLTLDLSRSRVEMKYGVAAEDVPALLRRIHADEREDYDVRTLYFDRADGSLARRAFEDPLHCTKVRLRDYADGSPWVWFEVKTREGRWTRKSRLQLTRDDVARCLAGDVRVPGRAPAEGDIDARLFLDEARRGHLVAVGAVHATRLSFLLKKSLVRLTLDLEIAYHRPATAPFAGEASGMSGPLIRRESEPVLELKHVGCLPPNCLELVDGLRPTNYSKFRSLVRCLSESGGVTGRVDRL